MSATDEHDDDKTLSAGRIGLIVGGGAALLAVLLLAVIYLSPPKVLASLPLPHPGRSLGIKALGGSRLVLEVDDVALKAEAADDPASAAQSGPAALDKAIRIIARRLQALGVRDGTVSRLGADRILVEAPGFDDPERLAAVATKTARLTFQMVDDTVSAEEAKAGLLPPGDELLQGFSTSTSSEVVKAHALLDDTMLADAKFVFSRDNDPVVAFDLTPEGARRFAALTSDNVGKRFAIVLDGRVIMAPVINTPITGGGGIIEGGFTVQSAHDFAMMLNTGALPVPLKVVEQQRVAPQ